MTEKFPDISNQKCMVMGLQGSGKTYYSKELVKKKQMTVLVYAPHKHDFANEPDNFIFYKFTDYYKDFAEFVELSIKLGKERQVDGVFIDEFDMLFRNNFDISQEFNDLVLNHRHYNLSLIGISRRPQDIPTKVFESSKYSVFFAMDAPNVRNKLNAIYSGMGDTVAELSHGGYGCVVKEIGKPPVLFDGQTNANN